MEPFPSTVLSLLIPRRFYRSLVLHLWLLSGLTLTPVQTDQSTIGMAYSSQLLIERTTTITCIHRSIHCIFFRLTSDADVLTAIDSLVSDSFRDVEGFQSTEALVATWKDVVPYSEGTTEVMFRL